MRRRSTALLTAALLAGTLAACGGDQEQVSSSGSSVSTAPSASATPSSAAPSAEASPVPDSAGTEPVETEPVGGPLSVTAVRVAAQDGYDRVVFELDGTEPGEPGWRVAYTDAPSAQGSGEPVAVTGAATLGIDLTGVGYPFDTGVTEVSGDPTLPAGLGVVTDVVLGAVFEGRYQAFIGLSAESRFTVTRLADPARVVVDIFHG